MMACGFDDFACMDNCFMQADNATHDPSSCIEDPAAQCGGGGGGGVCVGDWNGQNCKYDYDCSTDNCTNDKCYARSIGNPCDYDYNCESGNCTNGCCQARTKGSPCDYGYDCESGNCYDHKCQ